MRAFIKKTPTTILEEKGREAQFREGGAKAGRHSFRTKDESLHLSKIRRKVKTRRRGHSGLGPHDLSGGHVGQEALHLAKGERV